ncbi:hypothetical protein [Mycolicibacterium confluentis]|uniref:Uncharacterized protein n=1 Tax=Mycolicibacterium confluentis TaxID=28047 RepID=A0A7I7XRF5_9MYCO|nr:hypothetical protein [Mycolicibacterium confluentis]MCV7321080.1 hypothetical protein [Mycolicibacterium confluentis]ORV25965.1 hypothetical protein AWB99_21545 [Mycolicibacterium confluentis]BBZ31552.1 hypothetical protein MCNF_01570 [Mycolicibacterium confluentis]
MNQRKEAPDIDRLSRSMVLLHGGHDDDDEHHEPSRPSSGSWRKAPDYASDPDRAAAIRAASQADRDRYLTSGLTPVDCRFCHATVAVKKLGPEHTAVQWNSDATQRCAVFAEARAEGKQSSQLRACPRLSDSIKHAIAEGCLEAVSTAPSPGDG